MVDRNDKPLACPECASTVAWDGTQFVCPTCPWTEYTEKPPSSGLIVIPEQIRKRTSDPKKDRPGS